MRDELENSDQLEQHELRAKAPPRASASQDKASAWLITIRFIRVKWVTPQGFTYAPSIHLDDRKRTSRLRLSGAASIAAVQHGSHTVGVWSGCM